MAGRLLWWQLSCLQPALQPHLPGPSILCAAPPSTSPPASYKLCFGILCAAPPRKTPSACHPAQTLQPASQATSPAHLPEWPCTCRTSMNASPTLGASRRTRRPPQRQSRGRGGSSPCLTGQCKANLRSWSQPRGWSCSGALGRSTVQSAHLLVWQHSHRSEGLEVPLGAIALAGFQVAASATASCLAQASPSTSLWLSACPTWCCRNWPKDAWSKVRHQHSSKSHWVSVHFSVSWVASSEGALMCRCALRWRSPAQATPSCI